MSRARVPRRVGFGLPMSPLQCGLACAVCVTAALLVLANPPTWARGPAPTEGNTTGPADDATLAAALARLEALRVRGDGSILVGRAPLPADRLREILAAARKEGLGTSIWIVVDEPVPFAHIETALQAAKAEGVSVAGVRPAVPPGGDLIYTVDARGVVSMDGRRVVPGAFLGHVLRIASLKTPARSVQIRAKRAADVLPILAKVHKELPIRLPDAGARVKGAATWETLVITVAKDGTVCVDDEALKIDNTKALDAAIHRFASAHTKTHKRVRIDADRRCAFQLIVRVLDLCQFRGLKDCGFRVRDWPEGVRPTE